jgi:SAM-dependent methyltransferase
MKIEHFRKKFDEVAEYLPSPGPMLDVGCAAGFLIEAALERGWDPKGVELNPGFAAYTSRALDGRITYGRLRGAPLASGFSLITLFDLLEHTPTPREDLARCRELLAPNGAILVQLPCLDALGRRLLGRCWYHYGPPAHLSYFSVVSFTKLVESLGLRIVHQAWTRKLVTVEYLLAQLALDRPGLGDRKIPPAIGALQLRIPMSERLFLLRFRA